MYKIKMVHTDEPESGWVWYIYGVNGKMIAHSKIYKNRAHCRNVMINFAFDTRIVYEESK